MIYDFIVIGAGIAGAAIAYELANHGRTCLLEMESMPGKHSTGRSAALLSLSYGSPTCRALTKLAGPFFEQAPEGFAATRLISPRGQMFVGRPDQHERVRTIETVIRTAGGNPVRLDQDEAGRLVPLLRSDRCPHVLLDRDVADIDVDALHQGFLRAAKQRGTTIMTNSEASGFRRMRGLWTVAFPDKTVRAPVIVNAGGAWADKIGMACGSRGANLAILRRTALLIDPPAGTIVDRWPAVFDPDEKFYFKPDAGKILVSPADEIPDVPCDAQPEEIDIAMAVDRVQSVLNIEVRSVSHSWAGLRVFARDRDPVLGPDPDVEGLFWCAGQGGTGVQTAPAMARIGAALVQGDKFPPEAARLGLTPEMLSPGRFAR